MNNNATLPEAMKAVNPAKVSAMVRSINKALDSRLAFERQKAPHSALIEYRRANAFMRNNRRLGAFLAVVGADPDQMLNRTRKAGTRANLKGIKKVRQLLDYLTGETNRFERVSLALFASSIIAAKKGIQWISNNEQELILSTVDVGSLPEAVREAIEEYKHKYMTLEGDSRNQSCQFRTTFANLGCYYFSNEDVDDSNRNGIQIDLDSPIIRELNRRWNLDSVE
jgi:hypothetical protein